MAHHQPTYPPVHTLIHARIRTQSRAQSYQYTRMEMFYLLSCFCSWLALKFSALSAWDASLEGSLPAWLLPAWLLRRVWQLARSWGHDGCDVQQDAGHGEGEGESSYARPRDVYAIWVISAPRGSRNRPVAASLATRQHEIMLILTIKFEQPQLTSPLPSSSPSPSQSLSTSTAAAQSIAKRAQI